MNQDTTTEKETEYCNCCGIQFGDGEYDAHWPSRKNLDYLSGIDKQGNKTYCCEECQQEAEE